MGHDEPPLTSKKHGQRDDSHDGQQPGDSREKTRHDAIPKSLGRGSAPKGGIALQPEEAGQVLVE